MIKEEYNKADYIKQQETIKCQLEKQIINLAESFKEKPEVLADTLKFGSKFYHYSIRNTMLIYTQNEYATFVESYKALKDKGYNVQKGEKGMKVLVPVKTTLLKINDELIKLSSATKQQKADFKFGKIEGFVKTNYKVGTVFDISQTDCPTKEYPKLYHMGYENEHHNKLYNSVKTYSETELGVIVSERKMTSISLRGYYSLEGNTIYINNRLKDTEKLSTLIHELGHAELHKDIITQNRPLEQIEFEADSISIMLQQKLGLPVTKGRQRHLHQHYMDLYKRITDNAEVIKQLPEELQAGAIQKAPTVGKVLNNVFEHYKNMVETFEQTIDNSLLQQREVCQNISKAQSTVESHYEPNVEMIGM